ncbi:hypothetical protein [Rhizohabitans arisaemae]|uniref:hypothetical protein n=1 Tax=Rhizohabitans arisaemae TaxID=2720610 RepID=UPI0024B1A46A|nr:hypothetical protein [Rhizohabitans arisaemae]
MATALAISVAAVGGAVAVNQVLNNGVWNWWWIVPAIALVTVSTAVGLFLNHPHETGTAGPGESAEPAPYPPATPDLPPTSPGSLHPRTHVPRRRRRGAVLAWGLIVGGPAVFVLAQPATAANIAEALVRFLNSIFL